MKAVTMTLLLLALLPAAIAGAGEAPEGSWPGVTVLLEDGWRYRDVIIYRDAKGAGFWVLRADGAERLVSGDRIAGVVGPDGEDITRRVLSGERGPGAAAIPGGATSVPAGAAPAGHDAAMPAAAEGSAGRVARRMRLAFTLEGGWGTARGDWFEGARSSWSAGARLRVGTVGNSYLGLGARYQDFDGTDWTDVEGPGHAELYDLTFGWLSERSASGAISYLELGVGLMRSSYPSEVPGQGGDAENSGAFVLRGGVMVPMVNAVALDLGASFAYRGLLFKPRDEPAAALLAVHLGLTWRN